MTNVDEYECVGTDDGGFKILTTSGDTAVEVPIAGRSGELGFAEYRLGVPLRESETYALLRDLLFVSPPVPKGPTSTGITGAQGPTGGREDGGLRRPSCGERTRTCPGSVRAEA